METRMQCAWVNHFGKAKLLYATQALKVRMVDYIEQELRRNCYKAVYRVVKDFFLVHYTEWLSYLMVELVIYTYLKYSLPALFKVHTFNYVNFRKYK